MTGIVILHSYKTVIETDPSHQLPANINDEDIIYGQNISIRTRRFTVTVRLTSPESVVFLKVLIDDNVESNATARFIHVPAVPDRVTDISQNDVTNNTTNKIILDFTPVSNDIIGKVPDSSISIEIPSQVSGIVKWLVLVAILAFLSIMAFVLWKWQHRQTTCRKSDVPHSTYYTGLILDDAVTYGEPVHCKLPPQNKYIEVLPDLGGKLESV
ncbi:uncharacterized protein LOC125664048 [Ostrea edulis]|uniref:uncharacterized protein LOC125664048 n=1 Tax=Ostrea edulis TaxID=37623 RepID=UPI0024AF0D2F|nr:uncharacterized protein LOC125664048 [Ostrea edulis]